jgi:hypothetical protein
MPGYQMVTGLFSVDVKHLILSHFRYILFIIERELPSMKKILLSIFCALMLITNIYANDIFQIQHESVSEIDLTYQLKINQNQFFSNLPELIQSLHFNQWLFVDTSNALPVHATLVNLNSKNYQLHLNEEKWIPIHITNEKILTFFKNNIQKSNLPEKPAWIQELGKSRGFLLGVLNVIPYKIINNQIYVLQSARIVIQFENVRNASRFDLGESMYPTINKKSGVQIANQINVSKQTLVSNPVKEYYGSAVRFYVNEEGIYKITYEDLVNANIDPVYIEFKEIKLLNQGKEVPYFVMGDEDGRFDPGDYIEFWGEPLLNHESYPKTNLYYDPFTKYNVYVLVWGHGNGVRMIEEAGSLVETNPLNYNPSTYFRDRIHLEENKFFDRLGYFFTNSLTTLYDTFFFDGGISAPGKKNYSFELIYPDSSSFDPIHVKVMLQGRSPGNQHVVQTWINDQFVNQVSDFYGQQFVLLESSEQNPVYSSQLQQGINTLDIQLLQNTTGSGADIVTLNWFEIEYDRQYKAYKNYIKFKKPSFLYFPDKDLFQFTISNFTIPNIEIYKKGVSKIVGFQVTPIETEKGILYTVSFQDRIVRDDIEYIALTDKQKLKPAKIELMQLIDPESVNADLLNPANRADYLIITHPQFYIQAKDLVEALQSTGHEIQLIDVQNIYDQFNYGIKSPFAIKKFLKYAYSNWDQSNKLHYVLLLGDATYDPAENIIKGKDLIPAFFYQTYKFGAVPTDLEYSLLEGNDLLPDISIGRVPVSLLSELIQYTEKVKKFLSLKSDSWTNKSIFISGNDGSTFEIGDGRYPAFRSQNQRLIDLSTPKTFTTYKLNTVKDPKLDFDPNFGSTTDLINYFDEGVAFVNFVGHGGGGIWADVSLMDLSDVDLLSNDGKFPFVSSLTCFTGAFENAYRYGLGEKMLFEKDKGCIAWFGSSGLGWLHNDFTMGWKLPEYVLKENLPFGDAVNLTKIFYLSSYYYPGTDTLTTTPGYGFLKTIMVHQYNLLGDPTLKLPLPRKNLSVIIKNNWLEPGDTLIADISALDGNYEGYYELANYKNEPVIQFPLQFSGTQYELKVKIPDDFPSNEAFLRIYLNNGDEGFCGVASFAVREPYIKNITITPDTPIPGQAIQLKISVANADQIDSMKIRWLELNTNQEIYTQKLDSVFVSDPIQLKNDQFEYFYSIYAYIKNIGLRKYIHRKLSIQDLRPDLVANTKFYRFIPRNDSLYLTFWVKNTSLNISENDTVELYVGQNAFRSGIPTITKIVDINANDSVAISYFSPDYSSLVGTKVYVNCKPSFQDRNSLNNLDSVILDLTAAYIVQDLGISFNKKDVVTLEPDSGIFLSNQKLPVSSGFIFYEKQDIGPLIQNLTNIKPVPLKSGQIDGFRFSVMGENLDSIFKLQFNFDPSAVANLGGNYQNIRIYKWESSIQQWLGQNSKVDSVHMIVELSPAVPGLYAVFYNDDRTPPNIEFTVDGRPLITRAIVSNRPRINVYIEDENGVQIDRNLVQIMLNDKPIQASFVYIPDSLNNPGSLGIQIYPELDIGEHLLTVRVRDINGNLTEKTVSMLVEQDFDIHVFGNYPNPFTDKTIFSYYITNSEVIDDFEIRIYTISGRLIKVLKEDENTVNTLYGAKQLGYNELIWDGTDEDGNEVSNGVYFALFRAKYQGKVKEKIIKVARLR